MTKGEKSLAQHLSLLPDEALDNVFRHLSDEPWNDNWMSSFSLDFALQLFKIQGPLSRAARRCLPRLSAAREAHNSLQLPWGKRENSDLLSTALSVMGPFLTEVNVGGPMASQSWISVFIFQCTNLKSLMLCSRAYGSHLPAILAVCSRRLQSLSLKATALSTAEVQALARHCIGLEECSLRVRTNADMDAFWIAVGPTLRKIEFFNSHEDFDSVNRSMTGMTETCLHVQEFSIWCFAQVVAEQMATLLANYAGEIRSLELHGKIEPAILRTVASAWSNAEVAVSLTPDSASESLWALKLCAFDVTLSASFLPSPDFERAAKACPNLGVLHFSECSLDTPALLRALLAHPKSRLEVVVLCFSENDADTYEAIAESCEIIAKFVQSLREFELITNLLPAEGLSLLAASNPLLERVYIEYSGSALVTESDDGDDLLLDDCVFETSKGFLSCTRIRYYVLVSVREFTANVDRDFTELRDLCVPLRHRRVVVSILSVSYVGSNSKDFEQEWLTSAPDEDGPPG